MFNAEKAYEKTMRRLDKKKKHLIKGQFYDICYNIGNSIRSGIFYVTCDSLQPENREKFEKLGYLIEDSGTSFISWNKKDIEKAKENQ